MCKEGRGEKVTQQWGEKSCWGEWKKSQGEDGVGTSPNTMQNDALKVVTTLQCSPRRDGKDALAGRSRTKEVDIMFFMKEEGR